MWLPLAVILLLGGFAATAFYFFGTSTTVTQVSKSSTGTGEAVTIKQPSFILELIAAVTASGLLGFGTMFLALWAGIYL